MQGPDGRSQAPRGARLCASSEVAEGAVVSRVVAGVPVAVARCGGRLVAFGALCPHQQTDLSDGRLDADSITCSRHLWRFELATGRCAMVPGASLPLYAVREADGAVWVEVPSCGAR